MKTLKSLKTLVFMQISDKINIKGYKKDPLFFPKILAYIALFFGLIFVFYLFFGNIRAISYLNISPFTEFLITFLLFTQIIATIQCTSGLISSLYMNKENILTMSLPVTPVSIFSSKLIAYYIYELRKNLLFLLPLMIGYGLTFSYATNFGALYILKSFLSYLVIPLFPVIIGAILTTPIIFLKTLLKKSSLLTFILTFIVIISMFVVSYFFIKSITNEYGVIRIQLFIKQLHIFVNNTFPKINKFSFHLKPAVKLLLSTQYNLQYTLNIVYVFSYFIGLLLVGFGLSYFMYFKLSSKTFEESTNKKYKLKKDYLPKNIYFKVLSKELKTLIRSSNQVAGSLFFISIMPILIYFITKLFDGVGLSDLGQNFSFFGIIFIGLLILLTSNSLSATIISREGSEFYVLKTCPFNIKIVVAAKMTINAIICLLAIISTAIILLINNIFSINQVIIIFFIYLLSALSHLIWSAELDIINPQLHEFASKGNIDDNKNITKSITIGFIMTLFISLSYMFFWLENKQAGNIKIFGILIVLLVYRIIMMYKKTQLYFEEIE